MPESEPDRLKLYTQFDDEVRSAVEKSITNLLGSQVLNSLYGFLTQYHDVSKNDVPYRLEPLFSTLESTFGFNGSRTISRVIAREVYDNMGLKFVGYPDYRLTDYLNEAKKQLSEERVGTLP